MFSRRFRLPVEVLGVNKCSVHFANIRSLSFIKLYKKSDQFMFFLDQILGNAN